MVKAILLMPAPPEAFMLLFDMCESLGENELMLQICSEYSETNNKDQNGMINLAATYLLMQKKDQAINTVNMLIRAYGDEMRENLKDDKRFDVLIKE